MLEPTEVEALIALARAQLTAIALVAIAINRAGHLDMPYLDAAGRALIETEESALVRDMLSIFVGTLGHGVIPEPDGGVRLPVGQTPLALVPKPGATGKRGPGDA